MLPVSDPVVFQEKESAQVWVVAGLRCRGRSGAGWVVWGEVVPADLVHGSRDLIDAAPPVPGTGCCTVRVAAVFG